MLPILRLGEPLSGAPEIEFLREEIHPIIACVVDLNFDMSDELLGEFLALAIGDCNFLNQESAPAFSMIEDVCWKIVTGEITKYSVVRLQASHAAGLILLDYADNGRLSPKVIVAAQRFLDFLKANPDYWPPRFAAGKPEHD